MQMSQLHYLPLTPGFFSILVGVFFILLILLMLGALRRAYLNLGVSSTTAMLLLLGSLIGSYFNIPIAELPQRAGRVQPGDRILRHAVHRAGGGALAGHRHRRQCRRRRHPDADVALSAHHPADVGQGS